MDVASGRTGMRAKALASQQARSQNLDCNNRCGTYAEYALAQRLRLPASMQNMDRPGIAVWFSHHPQYSGLKHWLPSVKALVQNPGIGTPNALPRVEAIRIGQGARHRGFDGVSRDQAHQDQGPLALGDIIARKSSESIDPPIRSRP